MFAKTALFLFIVGMSLISMVSVKPNRIFYKSWQSLKVPEPSDMALSSDKQSIFVVSDDDSKIYEIDLSGKILRSSKTLGIDLEAVCVFNGFIYAVDETARRVLCVQENSLSLEKTFHVPYSGGRNKGFESIGFNSEKGCFVLITEKDPIKIIELNKEFVVMNEIQWKHARDISSITFFNNAAYLLSDEDMTIFRCNPMTYDVMDQCKINVHNPEGLLFLTNEIFVLSDDLERLYRFDLPK